MTSEGETTAKRSWLPNASWGVGRTRVAVPVDDVEDQREARPDTRGDSDIDSDFDSAGSLAGPLPISPSATISQQVADAYLSQESNGAVMAPSPGSAPVRGRRKARLQITQVDPWSVMKLGILLSIGLGIMLVVSTAILWWLLDKGAVFERLDTTVTPILDTSTSHVNFTETFSFNHVMGVALVVAAVQVVLLTSLATLAAFLYNLGSGLVGGLEVTLADDA